MNISITNINQSYQRDFSKEKSLFLCRKDRMNKLSRAENVIYDLAEFIAGNIISRKNFIISKDAYLKEDQDEIVKRLLQVNEIANVFPEMDGLHIILTINA